MPSPRGPLILPIIRLAVDVKARELVALGWSWLYLFCLMAGYYIFRPLRDEIGSVHGADDLPWMYTVTFLVMLAAVPAFSALVARYPRRVFVPLVYRFFNVNLLIFFALLAFIPEERTYPVAIAFFVWVSVYNLFVVAVFWGFMADVWRSEEGKRLFGFIAFGASLGGVMGAGLVSIAVESWGRVNLMLITIALMECAVWCVHALGREADRRQRLDARGAQDEAPRDGSTHDAPRSSLAAPARAPNPAPINQAQKSDLPTDSTRLISGSVWAGFTTTVRSPYLLGIVVYIFLYSYTSTVLYYQQAELVNVAFETREARAAYFARLDVAVNVLSLLCQAFLTGRAMKWLGVSWTLAILPLATVAAFVILGVISAADPPGVWFGVAPFVAAFVPLYVMRRAGNFAFGKPARDVLFTVVAREDKYKSKSFIDTAVYRGGDAATGWIFAGMQALGLGMAGISFATAPIAFAWVILALALGTALRRKQRLSTDEHG